MATSTFGVARASHDGRETRALASLLNAANWINTSRLSKEQLLGKVVVVNFCTYTCINWLRTLPYVRAWARKYGTRLVMIGVHTPEFGFEANTENVRTALKQLQVDYPVVIDNDYSIWKAFNNQYWPALYFIDAAGNIKDQHFGEGEYERSERIMQRLLKDAGAPATASEPLSIDASGIEVAADWNNLRSPETYLGSDRGSGFTASARPALNQWGLHGKWTTGRQALVLDRAPGSIRHRFHARDVHLVIVPPRVGTAIRFQVTIDGQPPGIARGLDVDAAGNGSVVDARLYQLIRQQQPIVDRQFEIEFLDAGVQAFAFTFG